MCIDCFLHAELCHVLDTEHSVMNLEMPVPSPCHMGFPGGGGGHVLEADTQWETQNCSVRIGDGD